MIIMTRKVCLQAEGSFARKLHVRKWLATLYIRVLSECHLSSIERENQRKLMILYCLCLHRPSLTPFPKRSIRMELISRDSI